MTSLSVRLLTNSSILCVSTCPSLEEIDHLNCCRYSRFSISLTTAMCGFDTTMLGAVLNPNCSNISWFSPE
jgi:hypothetical protein